MTTMVNQEIIAGIPGTPLQALAFPVAALVTAFLIGLLVVRLLGVAADRSGARLQLQVLDVALIPLFIAFAAIVYKRIQEILPLG